MCIPCLPTVLDWIMSIITIFVCVHEPDGCVNQGVTRGILLIAILTLVAHALEIIIQWFVKVDENGDKTFKLKSLRTAVIFTIIHLIKLIVICGAIIPKVKPSVVDYELKDPHSCSYDANVFGPMYAFITFMFIIVRAGLHYCHITNGTVYDTPYGVSYYLNSRN